MKMKQTTSITKTKNLKYRLFYTSSGKLVLAGKNAQQNEEIVKNARSQDIILHTKSPGSPFCVLSGKVKPQDIKEAAVFCACFSQGWKKKKKVMEVHIFRGSQVIKEPAQKIGSFCVLSKIQGMKVKLKLGLKVQKNKLRAVPVVKGSKVLILLEPGRIKKEKAAEKIKEILKQKFNLCFSKEEILQAIPSGGFNS